MIKVVLFDVGKVLIRFSGPQFGLYRLAKRIRRAGLRVGILSNVIMPAGIILKRLHVYRGFSPVVLSYEEGIRKPNPQIFERTIERLGVKPEEILFVDNLERNLTAAEKLGMQGIHVISTKQAIADIKSALEEQNGLRL